ncbi:MAG: tetratricopeptide repeat protein, partial [Lachnospiraceae bacterium]
IGGNSGKKLAEQLELADRYMDELNYEAAIAAYEAAIEIDPMCVEAYLGIVEAYIRDGEYELALDYAQRGYEATGDDRLAEKIEMLQSGNIKRSDGLIVMMTVYDDAGEVLFRHEYTYDRENIQNSVSHYDGSGNLTKTLPISENESYGWYNDTGEIFKISYKYEDDLITELHYDEDDVTVTGWVLTETDDNGVPLRCMRGYGDNVGSKDEVTVYEEYGFDEKGNKVMSIYDSDYQLIGKQVWERDEQGKLQRYVYYDENGNINWYRLYEYDKDGNMVAEREYDAENNLKYESVYD